MLILNSFIGKKRRCYRLIGRKGMKSLIILFGKFITAFQSVFSSCIFLFLKSREAHLPGQKDRDSGVTGNSSVIFIFLPVK